MELGPIAIASSYGLPGREVLRAFDRGARTYFWGALRHRDFGGAVRRLARGHRDAIAIAVQTFARSPWLVRASVELARRQLGVDALDVLVLGFWNTVPPRAIVGAVLDLKRRGIVRSLAISCHVRATLASLQDDDAFDRVMVRYNAAHTGAEQDVLPLAIAHRKPVIAYTATRWGTLLRERATPDGERTPSGADCYRFVLSHAAVGTCLAGPKDAAELDGVLDANARGPMTPDEIAWMRRVGANVRAHARVPAPPLTGAARLAGVWDHAKGIAREVRARGITEDLVSRFNR